MLPADQLMDKKVPKPLLLLKGMPCLTAEVLRALLPSARCSGYAHWRPVLIYQNGSTVSIRWIGLDSQMLGTRTPPASCYAGKEGDCVGLSRDPLLC